MGSMIFSPSVSMGNNWNDWYTTPKLEQDVQALRSRGVAVESLVYPAGHEWTPDVSAAASAFVHRL